MSWFHPWRRVFDADYDEVDFAWFSGGRLNACFNAVDRHVETDADRTAIIWAADEPGVYERISYRKLKHEVCRLANVLLAHHHRRLAVVDCRHVVDSGKTGEPWKQRSSSKAPASLKMVAGPA